MRGAVAIAFFLELTSCGGGEDAGDPCAGVSCSDHGLCRASGSSAQCFCDPGFEPLGLTCVDEGGSDSDVDSDSDGDTDSDSDTGSECPDGDGDHHDDAACGGDDCDDADSSINPTVREDAFNCVDDDCDGIGTADDDEDGEPNPTCGGADCDDADAARRPGLEDFAGDLVDQNCDGVDGLDADGDGWASELSGGTDCDDADRDRSPGIVEDDEWIVEVVDDDGAADLDTSLAIDGDGNAHVAWQSANGIYHGSIVLGAWRAEFIDDGQTPSIAYDGTNGYIAYYDHTQQDLELARNEGGAWLFERVDGDVDSAGTDPALVFAGDAHIAYESASDGDLLYVAATPGSGTFVPTVVQAGSETGREPSLVLSAGEAHIAYRMRDGSAYYSWGRPGEWNGPEPIEVGADTGRDCSIGAADDGTIGVVYQDAAEAELRYATRGAGFWSSEMVEPDGSHPALAYDGDVAHVVFSNGTGHLGYATNLGGDWTVTTASSDTIPAWTSIEIAEGRIHAAWCDVSTAEVMYGSRAPGDGIDQDCDDHD